MGSGSENATKGHYGVTALPLLTGTEVEGPMPGQDKVIREGTIEDMYISLMSEVGGNIRVLRGHTLKSDHAPVAGIRYDGL